MPQFNNLDCDEETNNIKHDFNNDLNEMMNAGLFSQTINETVSLKNIKDDSSRHDLRKKKKERIV